ncbi:MAG: ADP-ribosylglycohydrolase family protein [Chthoniobacteraceae bacterium]
MNGHRESHSPTPSLSTHDRIAGLLLGTAVGDALGLPAEGISPKRIARLWRGDWHMRLVCGRGMVSDDTEHTIMLAQALLAAPDSAEHFQRLLARKLRWWFLGLPAGVGMATAKACIKLWLGISPRRSGVWSAGNGPAMRCAIIGAFFPDDQKKRHDYVAASTRMTHSDPRAEIASLAVTEAAALIVTGQPEKILSMLPSLGDNAEWQEICRKLAEADRARATVAEFAAMLGLFRGVTGYAYHTVPVAIYAFVRHGNDFRETLTAVLNCGGDTDTVGAIVGALVGANVGVAG